MIAVAAIVAVVRAGTIGYAANGLSYSSVSTPEAAEVYAKVAAKPAALKFATPATTDISAGPVVNSPPYIKSGFPDEYSSPPQQYSYIPNDFSTGSIANGGYSLNEVYQHSRFNTMVQHETVVPVTKIESPVAYSAPVYAGNAAPSVGKVAYSPATAVSYSSIVTVPGNSVPSYYHWV